MLGGIETEYREGVDDHGQVTRPRELSEAQLLLVDLRALMATLPDEGRSLGPALDALASTIAAKAPPADVLARVSAIRLALPGKNGARGLESTPPLPPSAERGAALFAEHCATCHGARGAADGPVSASLIYPPADFTDPEFMRAETPADFFQVVSLGRRTAGMPAWLDALDVQQRWDVVSYVWSLGIAPPALAAGAQAFKAHCESCHTHIALDPFAWRSDDELLASIRTGVGDGRMPGFAATLSDAEQSGLVAHLRQRSLGVAGAGGPPRSPAEVRARAMARVGRLVAAAVDAYETGEPDPAGRAAEAYLAFEPLEPGIAATDPSLVVRAEAAFDRLRSALRQPGAVSDVRYARTALDRALAAIPTDPNPPGGQRAVALMIAGLAAVTVAGVWLWRRS